MSINAALKQNSETGKIILDFDRVRFGKFEIWQIYDLPNFRLPEFKSRASQLSLLSHFIFVFGSERLPNKKSFVSYTILWNNMQKRTSFSNRQLVKLPNSIPFLHNFSTYFRLNRTKENSKSTLLSLYSQLTRWVELVWEGTLVWVKDKKYWLSKRV